MKKNKIIIRRWNPIYAIAGWLLLYALIAVMIEFRFLTGDVPVGIRIVVFSIFLSVRAFLAYLQIMLVRNVRAIIKDRSRCIAEVLFLLLVPFYEIYWWFTRGKLVKQVFTANGIHVSGNGVIYLLMSIFGLSFIATSMMQYDFNSLSDRDIRTLEQSKINWALKKGAGQRVYLGVIMAFLYLPIIYLIAYSFNDGKTSVWKGFTFRWYTALFNDAQIMGSLKNTLLVAVIASVVATILGTAAAIGIYNFKGGMRSALQNVSNIPIINPEIVTGVSLMLLFTFSGRLLGFEMGFWTVLLAHIGFCTPYVLLNVTPRLKQMDHSLYEAALDLGCSPVKAFFKVVMHELMPGILSGFLISFTYSLDDFVITYFTRGSRFQTLPIQIYTMTHQRINPKANALSALLFVVIFVILVVSNFAGSRKDKEEAR